MHSSRHRQPNANATPDSTPPRRPKRWGHPRAQGVAPLMGRWSRSSSVVTGTTNRVGKVLNLDFPHKWIYVTLTRPHRGNAGKANGKYSKTLILNQQLLRHKGLRRGLAMRETHLDICRLTVPCGLFKNPTTVLGACGHAYIDGYTVARAQPQQHVMAHARWSRMDGCVPQHAV